MRMGTEKKKEGGLPSFWKGSRKIHLVHMISNSLKAILRFNVCLKQAAWVCGQPSQSGAEAWQSMQLTQSWKLKHIHVWFLFFLRVHWGRELKVWAWHTTWAFSLSWDPLSTSVWVNIALNVVGHSQRGWDCSSWPGRTFGEVGREAWSLDLDELTFPILDFAPDQLWYLG